MDRDRTFSWLNRSRRPGKIIRTRDRYAANKTLRGFTGNSYCRPWPGASVRFGIEHTPTATPGQLFLRDQTRSGSRVELFSRTLLYPGES